MPTFKCDIFARQIEPPIASEIDCSLIFPVRSHNRFSIQPLTILGVTGPFSVLAENIYSLCTNTLKVSTNGFDLTKFLSP